MKPIKPLTAVAVFGLALGTISTKLPADTFGSGVNAFTINFANIGSPGNDPQNLNNRIHSESGGDNYGAVNYSFRMSVHTISTGMIDKANAEGSLGITRTARSPNLPATNVSWNEAARFVNFLNDQAGHPHAYKFANQPGSGGGANDNIQLWDSSDPGYDPSNPYRNSNAFYFLPSEDEWFKAAYYSASLSRYYLFATGSDTAPTAVASGTAPGTAVYSGQSGPADIDQAGGLSPFGTMGQTGNINEWMESAADGENDSPTKSRARRGGAWTSGELFASSATRDSLSQDGSVFNLGFRVASIPEPSAGLVMLVGLVGFGAFIIKRRHKS